MLRVANAVMAALFALAAAVQVNDPDPVRWMAVYGAACACSLMAARGRSPHPAVPAALAAIAVTWAVTIGLRVGASSYPHMFDAWEMKTPAIEEAREATGLVLVAGWMLVGATTSHLTSPVRTRKSRRRPSMTETSDRP
jgi:hypothetical protein